jgi:hypothetical protein
MLLNGEVYLDVKKFIIDWNNKYPYDRWWRKKYNISFGSEDHKRASFVNMSIEYKEDIYFKKLSEEDEIDDFEREVDKMIGSNKEDQIGDKKVVKMTKKELDKEFEDIDLDDFN